MGWDEVCGRGGGAGVGRAEGNEMGAGDTGLGAAGSAEGAGEELERDGLGFGEMGMIGL